MNNVVFDDLWRFDLENVQWLEQKQPDLVGLVSEKVKTETPGKLTGHQLFSMNNKHLLLAIRKTQEDESASQHMHNYSIDQNTWSKVEGDY